MDKFEKEELKKSIRKLKKIIKHYQKRKDGEFVVSCCEQVLDSLQYELWLLEEQENK